ncbi:MAG: DNA alkylation repair protein [Saprospiraceae bacterium]|nr:DNA alkylation repair protein [Saprospiraceae bacterium]
MIAYMRNQFNFYGVSSTDRKLSIQLVAPKFLWTGVGEFLEFIECCWTEGHREFKYLALDLSRKHVRKLDASCVPFYEKLIEVESWWDTVDGIAPQIIGRLVQHDPAMIRSLSEKWIEHENFWYQRSALILQLFYKAQTDFKLLSYCINRRKESKEFFIQKAAGWALRQYSKTNPEQVKLFLAENKIPSLSYREGMKYILKEGL